MLLNGQQVNGPSFTIVPQEAFTRSYQAEDGSFNGGEFSSAVTKIIFDHNVLDVSFTGIDANGDPLSGTSFEFGTGGGTDIPLPDNRIISLVGQQVTVKKDGITLNTFSIDPEESREKSYSVATGLETSDTFAGTETRIVFEYDVVQARC